VIVIQAITPKLFTRIELQTLCLGFPVVRLDRRSESTITENLPVRDYFEAV